MSTLSKLALGWNDYLDLINGLIGEVKENYSDYTILAIARGGLFPGTMISYYTNQDIELTHFSSYTPDHRHTKVKVKSYPWDDKTRAIPKKILIVDDLIDSGKTMETLIKILKKSIKKHNLGIVYDIKTVVLIDKGVCDFKPDFAVKRLHTNCWIEFPYERPYVRND